MGEFNMFGCPQMVGWLDLYYRVEHSWSDDWLDGLASIKDGLFDRWLAGWLQLVFGFGYFTF